MKVGRYVAALIIAVAPSIPQLIGACSIPLMYGSWTRSPIVGDTNAPTNLVADVVVDRDEMAAGCACSKGCRGRSYVVFLPRAADDHTLPERIGYRFTVVAGENPTPIELDEGETYTTQDDVIGFAFGSNTPRVSFDVEVVAIDESGNESPPIVIEVDERLRSPLFVGDVH